MKTCTRCKETKPRTEFHKDRSKKDGYEIWCKCCIRVKDARYHANNREKVAAYDHEWGQKNPLKVKELTLRYRALKFGTQSQPISYESILDRDGLTCHICLGVVAPDDIHFDHVIPLSRGGGHVEDNIKVAHSVCNQYKSNKLLSELPQHES